MKLSLNNIDLRSVIKRDKYDFDIGYIIESPCISCKKYDSTFPKCIDNCEILAPIQTLLSAGISSSRN